MLYPVKIEFQDYPGGSWEDWSEYLTQNPTISKRVESDIPGESGLIVFDSANVSFKYKSGGLPYTAFSGDLSSKQRYLFRISFLKSDKSYEQKFIGTADFTTIHRPGSKPVIEFQIIDKLSALGILPATAVRVQDTLTARINAQIPSADSIRYFTGAGYSTVYLSAQVSASPTSLSSPIIFPGEILAIPTWEGGEVSKWTPYVVLDSVIETYDGIDSNKLTIAPNLDQDYPDGTYLAELFWGTGDPEPIYYEKEIAGVDVGIYSSGVLTSLDGIQIVEAIYKLIWSADSLVNLSGSSTFPVPAAFAVRMIDNQPFGNDLLSALKLFSDSMLCYILVDNSGDVVIQNKENLDSNGSSRSFGTTKIKKTGSNYFWDKIVDGVTVNLQSWLTDVNGNYLTGTGQATLQYGGNNISPKNPITKNILIQPSDGDPTTQAELNALAITKASEILNFYGKRRESINYSIHLDDNSVLFDILDHITIGSDIYFIPEIDYDGIGREINIVLVDTTGYSFDARQIVIGLAESNSQSISSGGSLVVSSGGSSSSYVFNPPFNVAGDIVSLSYNSSNLKLSGSSLDTIQGISTSDSPEFAGLKLTSFSGVLKASAGVISGSATTTDLTEGSNLYFTNARARSAISETITGIGYNSSTGVFSLSSGYVIPTTTEESNWNDAYSKRVNTWNYPLSFASNVVSFGYNSTNLKLTSNQLNTIQDIATTSNVQFGSITSSGNITVNAQHILISDTGPRIQFSETDGGTDAKNWDILVDGGIVQFRAINDAWTTNLGTLLKIYRAGDVYVGRKLYVNGIGTAALLSDENRNLTTGTISSGNISVNDGDSGSTIPSSVDLSIENSGSPVLSLVGGVDNASSIYFGDPAQYNAGRIIYDHSDNTFNFYIQSSLQLSGDTSTWDFQNNDLITTGNIEAGTYLHLNRSATYGAYITYERNGTQEWVLHGGVTASTDNFSFRNASNEDVLILLQDGSLGLGTSPVELFHLYSASPSIKVQTSNNTVGGEINFAGSAGTVTSQIIHDATNQELYITTNSGKIERIRFKSNATTILSTDFIPATSGNRDLGSSSYKWNDFYYSGDIIQYSGGTTGSSSFVSQTTGWRIDYSGNADFRYIFTDELRAKAFTADVTQALAGSDLLTKSVAKLYSNFTIPSTSGTFVVEDLPGLNGFRVYEDGDYILFRVFDRSSGLTIADVWGTVVLDTSYGSSGFDSATSTQRYTFTKVSGSSTGIVVYKGAEVLDFGQSGDGYIERTVLDSAGSPYSQIVTWTTNPYTSGNLTVIQREGVLSGITDADFGGSLSGHGVYYNEGANIYIKGNYFVKSSASLSLQNNSIMIGNISGTANSAVKISNTGTNSTSGVYGYTSSGNESFALRLDGTAQIAGWTFTDTYFFADGIKIANASGGVDGAEIRISSDKLGTGTTNSIRLFYGASGDTWGIEGINNAVESFYFGEKAGVISNQIAGWAFDDETLYNGTDIVISSVNKRISLNNNAMIYGYDAGGTGKHGIKIDTNNYWYSDKSFRVGGSDGLDYDGSTLNFGGTLSVNSIPNLPSDENLYSYLNFDGEGFVDNSGNGKDGILSAGTATFVSGVSGKAYYNQEANNGITWISYTDAAATEDEFTVSLWFNSQLNDGSGDTLARIISRDASDYWAITLDQSETGTQTLKWYTVLTGASHANSSIGSVTPFTWNHILFSINITTGYIRVYLNGEKIKEDTSATGYIYTSDRPIVLGGNTETALGPGNTFVGYFDEARYYTYASPATTDSRSADNEARALYLNPSGQKSTRISGNQIITGSILSTDWTTNAGSSFDLDNAIIKLGGSQVTSTGTTYAGSYLDGAGAFNFVIDSSNFIQKNGSTLKIYSTNFLLKTSGSIGLGATNYSDGDGVWISSTSSSRFRIGDAGSSRMQLKEYLGDTSLEFYNSSDALVASIGANTFIAGFDFDENKLSVGDVRIEATGNTGSNLNGMGIKGTPSGLSLMDVVKVGDFAFSVPDNTIDNSASRIDNYNFASAISWNTSDPGNNYYYHSDVTPTNYPGQSRSSGELQLTAYNADWVSSGTNYWDTTNGIIYLETTINSASTLAGKDVVLGFDWKMGTDGYYNSRSLYVSVTFNITSGNIPEQFYGNQTSYGTPEEIFIKVPIGTTSMKITFRWTGNDAHVYGLESPPTRQFGSLYVKDIALYEYVGAFVYLNTEGLRIYRSEQEKIELIDGQRFNIVTPQITVGHWLIEENSDGDLVGTHLISGNTATIAANT